MNCKPGEIAQFIDGLHRGCFVEVLYAEPCSLYKLPNGLWKLPETDQQTWVVKALGYEIAIITNKKHVTSSGFCGVPDKYLRPIRDPGEEAQDETLLWLPVPSTEREPA